MDAIKQPRTKGYAQWGINTIGLDLATGVFQVYGIDIGGEAVARMTLRRVGAADFLTNSSQVTKRFCYRAGRCQILWCIRQ